MGNKPLVTVLGNSLTNAIQTTLGAGNTRNMEVVENASVSENPVIIHANKTVEPKRGGKLVKSGSGKVVFEGVGLEKPISRKTHFSGFAAGDVKWTGLVTPEAVSAELWDTGNSSLMQRLDRADKGFVHTVTVGTGGAAEDAESIPVTSLPAAMPAGTVLTFTGGKRAVLSADAAKGVTSIAVEPLAAALSATNKAYYSIPAEIHLFPRNIDGYAILEANRTIIFENGRFPNSFNEATHDTESATDALDRVYSGSPFTFQSHTTFKGKPHNKIYQSDTDDKIGIFYPRFLHYPYEEVHFEGLNFYPGGGESTSGIRHIISTGNTKRGSVRYCTFNGTFAYAISVEGGTNASTQGLGYQPEDWVVEHNHAFDVWTQVFNILMGTRIRFFKNVVILETPPFDVTLVAYDFEGNNANEKISYVTFDSNEFHFLYTGGGNKYATAFGLQGTDAGMEEVDFINNKCFSAFTLGGGTQLGLDAYGVHHFRVRSNHFTGVSNLPIRLRACRDVQLSDNTIIDSQNHAEFEACADLTYSEGAVSNLTTNKIVEKESFFPALAHGAMLMAAQPLGLTDNSGSPLDNPARFRLYEHFDGMEISYNGATKTLSDTFIPPAFGNDHYRKTTVNTTYGTKAAITFTSSDISGNNIQETGHPFYTGEPVLLTSSGTFPTITNRFERMHVIKVDANNIQLASSLKKALDGDEETISAGGSGTHTLQRFNLTIHPILPAAINTTTGEINLGFAHNLADGAFLDYVNYGGTNAAGLYSYNQHDGTNTRTGVYLVKVTGANTIKLAENETNLAISTFVIPSTQGTGTHIFTPVLETRFSNNQYNVEMMTTVELHPHSRSKVYRRFSLTSALGALPTITGSTNYNPNDDLLTTVAKLFASQPPPIWEADAFFDLKASDLVGVIADGGQLTELPNNIAGQTFKFTQSDASLRGTFHSAGADGQPYIQITNNSGYTGNEDFPDLTDGFAFAIIGETIAGVNSGHYWIPLHNAGSGTAPNLAAWYFAIAHAGDMVWNNSGEIANIDPEWGTNQIILGRTGATSHFYRNGEDETSDSTKIAKPSRLHIGNAFSNLSMGAGMKIKRIRFWSNALSDEIATKFYQDHV